MPSGRLLTKESWTDVLLIYGEKLLICGILIYIQCFDTVHWLSGRVSGLIMLQQSQNILSHSTCNHLRSLPNPGWT